MQKDRVFCPARLFSRHSQARSSLLAAIGLGQYPWLYVKAFLLDKSDTFVSYDERQQYWSTLISRIFQPANLPKRVFSVFAPVNVAPSILAPNRLASLKSAPEKLAPTRLAPVKAAPAR